MDGSPALDSADTWTFVFTHDQNYTSRPQGLGCDRGAYENLYEKGILRGWTYFDINRNDIRDPSEGPVPGITVKMKEGSCPGGDIVETAISNPDGRYQIYDIEPGDYCISHFTSQILVQYYDSNNH